MFNRNDIDAMQRQHPRHPVEPHSEATRSEPPEDGQGLWKIVNERLSGRWKHAITLGVILAMLGGVVGYRSASIKYESRGIIHVAPKTNVVMREIPETGMLPRYPSFVQTQATLLSSPRVLDAALDHIFLESPPWSDRLEGVRVIRKGLQASVQRDSELIQVSFTHGNPAAAQGVLNGVIRAYTELYASADSDEVNQTLRKLRGFRENLRNQRFQRQAQIQELIAANELPFHDLEEIISQKVSRVESLDSQIRQLEHLVSLTESRRGEQNRTIQQSGDKRDELELDPVTGAPIDTRDLEAFDQDLRRLGRAREEAREDLEYARERFTPRHRAYQAADERFRVVQRMYDARRAIAVEKFLDADRMPVSNWAMQPQQRLAQLSREVEQERQIIADMQRTQLALHELRVEVEDIRHEERETVNRIRDLDREANALQRITVASFGELPSSPSQDRRVPFAIVGAHGGFAMGIGFFFLLASVDRRVYGVAQLGSASRHNQLLGVLPALSGHAGDIEASEVAAHCVHQIRNRIEVVRGPGKSVVLAVSSPYQGDGKTSLTLALAASFATSGYRTVLVDCDMIGQSLTRNLRMTNQPGIRECLDHGDVEHVLHTLPAENLSIIPAGFDATFGPERIRKADLDLLFQRLRRMFDVILVDTGPLVGSVESLPIACAADGVVLVMWRGRRQVRLEECVNAIHRTGAVYYGLVLNYAMPSDCSRYLSCSKVSAKPRTHSLVTPPGSGVSHNALLRAMQLTSRPSPRHRAPASTHDS